MRNNVKFRHHSQAAAELMFVWPEGKLRCATPQQRCGSKNETGKYRDDENPRGNSAGYDASWCVDTLSRVREQKRRRSSHDISWRIDELPNDSRWSLINGEIDDVNSVSIDFCASITVASWTRS